jgi:hypothetical protein
MAVTYLVAVYGDPAVMEIAGEACGLPEGARGEHYAAFEDILRRYGKTLRVLTNTPAEFLRARDFPQSLQDQVAEQFNTELEQAVLSSKWDEAEALCRKAIDAACEASVEDDCGRWLSLSAVLAVRDIKGSEQAFVKAFATSPNQALLLPIAQLLSLFRAPILLALWLSSEGHAEKAAEFLEPSSESGPLPRILAAHSFSALACVFGEPKKAIETLAASEHAAEFESLIVGIRIHLGESPAVAKEVLELGKDFAKSIDKVTAVLG